MIKKQLFCLLISISLVLLPFRQAQAFVPAAALAGYIITSSGAAYRIGQAGLAIGAIAMLLLSGDSTTTGTRARIGLSEGLEPLPREQKTSESTLYSPPKDAQAFVGCTFTIFGRYISNGSRYQLDNTQFQPCGDAWLFIKSWVDVPNSTSEKLTNRYGIAKRSGPDSDGVVRSFYYGYDSGYDAAVNYGPLDGGYSYVQAPRTKTDQFADVSIKKDQQTGKITFQPYTDDPDYQSTIDGTSTHPAVSSDGQTATMYGVDAGGNHRSLQTVFNGDGTVGIIEVTNNPDGSTVTIGQTNLDQVTGSIVSATTQTKTARVQLPETQTITTSPSPTTQTGTTTSTQPITVDVKFPSDYARQYEAQQAADSVVTKLEQFRTDMTKTSSTSPSDPPIPPFIFFGTTFDTLLAFQLPTHNSICPKPSFEWNGVNTFDSHCGLIDDHKTELSISMILMWVLLAFRVVLRS